MPGPYKISVLIPLYKGRNSIKACLESVIIQRDAELDILLLDNGCPEDTGEWAGYFLSQVKPGISWKLLEVPKNIGFAAGMNRLYELAGNPLVCFLNQDVVLEPDHLRILAEALETNPGWGGVCGTLYRKVNEDGSREVDTTGHVIFRDRIVRNRGTGKVLGPGEDVPWKSGEVFGISAACALYRREALEETREEEGPFDPDFFSYFEDIDLDYRMHRGGWKLGYVSEAVGAHELAGSGGRKEPGIRLRAYGNRRRLMWKHESCGSLMPDMGAIMLQEIYGWARAIFCDPLAWLIGPWVFAGTIGSIIRRRRRLDKIMGVDRKWVRDWLRSETERWRDRQLYT